MRHALLLLVLLPTWLLQAQPLNGSYTVGGASPVFSTLQDAASAIKSRGVSGPVFINVRPGTYTRNGGASTLFVLDSSVAGVSPTNRITFQPDAGAGGNVDNVILQADFNSGPGQKQLAIVLTDYTTIHNLTFRDADSMDTPVIIFIYASANGQNPSIEGLEIDGCKFIGTPYSISGGQFGTDIGIQSNQNLTSASFTRNRFYRVMRAITNENGSTRGGTIVVEDNEFYQGYGASTGAGSPIGMAIELACTHASVRRNLIDFAGGAGGSVGGIRVIHATSAIIERNLVMNRFAINAVGFTGISTYSPFTPVDSILIANNAIVANQAITAGRGMDLSTPNTRVLFNTIVDAGGSGGNNIALRVTGANCTVLNNIILEMSSASYVAFDQGNAGSAQNLVSDHNIIFIREDAGASGLVRRNGTTFTTLAGYQAGTNLDSHSVSKTVLFSDHFHLDECQAQDPDLSGIPVPGITIDYDGATRDAVKPFKGADESVRIPFDMFADGFRAGLSGAATSLAAADFFDNDNDADIAVPDFDNRRVLLFRNLRPSRSFVQSGTVFTSVRPTVIKLFDFDDDGHLDLVVGADSAAVQVFWGDGSGGFSSSAVVGTYGRVRSIEPGPFGGKIAITQDNGFLPTSSFIGYITNFRPGPRDLCHDAIRAPSPPFGMDTIQATMTDFVVGNLTGDQTGEIAALTIAPIPSRLILYKDLDVITTFPPEPCGAINCFVGTHNEYQFSTASYVGHNSSIAMRDFDGDGDNDLMTTSSSENACMFIRNQGNLNFSVDTIPAALSRGLVVLDYENDGDIDFVTTNRTLYDRGITVFLNDGLGHFTEKPNCFFPFASGFPNGIIASDFDLDGKTDIAIASSFDSLFVLYNLGGFNGTTGVEEHPPQQVPTEISLEQNYPNPFNPGTTIRYKLPRQGRVTLKVYNLVGQEVAMLVNEQKGPGDHVVQWNAGNVASGVYFYRLQAGEFTQTRKLILLR